VQGSRKRRSGGKGTRKDTPLRPLLSIFDLSPPTVPPRALMPTSAAEMRSLSPLEEGAQDEDEDAAVVLRGGVGVGEEEAETEEFYEHE